jgi:hypothetical protein
MTARPRGLSNGRVIAEPSSAVLPVLLGPITADPSGSVFGASPFLIDEVKSLDVIVAFPNLSVLYFHHNRHANFVLTAQL